MMKFPAFVECACILLYLDVIHNSTKYAEKNIQRFFFIYILQDVPSFFTGQQISMHISGLETVFRVEGLMTVSLEVYCLTWSETCSEKDAAHIQVDPSGKHCSCFSMIHRRHLYLLFSFCTSLSSSSFSLVIKLCRTGISNLMYCATS